MDVDGMIRRQGKEDARGLLRGGDIDGALPPGSDRALYRHGVGEIGDLMLKRIAGLPRDLQVAVKPRHPRAQRRRCAIQGIATFRSDIGHAHARPPSVRMARVTIRGARSILQRLAPWATAPSTARRLARRTIPASSALPFNAASTLPARHGLAATPPRAIRMSRIVLPSSSNSRPTAALAAADS